MAVGGDVFGYADRVVVEHLDHTLFTQGRQAHRAAHVVGEHLERSAVGDQAAVVIAMPLGIATMACLRTPKCR